ncbi:sodium:glutamate symporter [Pseudonocardia sp. EC080610-09]|uniref:sodium/glutamate symporter n=1 Tax=unclassified Pseudonocardia TaxID=2619320 RepID=UPI0006CB4044|nr:MULTISPECIES: sodium/glutamate symporter [unclassified Pseudonocardia]ALE75131.1 sodium:glutamate symporter [Pseudonocardia sp. EC080625-04]ALL74492.1 sodium:glutamate symporter [Pseudonocardia sp. EC080610-09]ALL81512.1 sodium:glutamate symporter [Pseudonocardia sp. EC080619-01]
MEFGPWSLVVDAGLIGGLLLVGTLVRRWVVPAQRLMLPASVVAGFLGLLLGPQVLGVLPFSDQLGTYASVLIAVVFACLGLGDDPHSRGFGRSTAAFSAYSFAMYALQVGLGMVLAYVLFVPVFGTPDGFGLLLFAGWAGGFGSAAAVGSVFADAGWEGAASLAFTSATVGMLAGVVGGIAIANWGARRGHTDRIGRFDQLPAALRTGLVPAPDREPTGIGTTSPSSIEPLGLQVCLIAAVTVLGYGVAEGIGLLVPSFAAPVFVLAFLAGLLVKTVARRTPAWQYCDQRSLKSISGLATDLLIVCGIASITPSLVADYWLPLTLLFVAALALNLAMFRWVAPKVMHGAWFEKSLFTWGWATGAVATSVALLRMVDPDLDSRTLEEFGLAYLPVAPLETASIAVTPLLVLAGLGWAVAGGWTAAGLVALALPFLLGWTRARSGTPDRPGERTS